MHMLVDGTGQQELSACILGHIGRLAHAVRGLAFACRVDTASVGQHPTAARAAFIHYYCVVDKSFHLLLSEG